MTPGAPHALARAEASSTTLRRSLCVAFGQDCWSRSTLASAAQALRKHPNPEAKGAMIALIKALHGHGNVRLNLIGALMVPGWSMKGLRAVARAMMAQPPGPEPGIIQQIRELAKLT